MKRKCWKLAALGLVLGFCLPAMAQKAVDRETMQAIYEEVKTPYKYGIVVEKDAEQDRSIDGPTVFRHGDHWYMIFFQSEKGDRVGYTTQLARSADLRNWERLGTILPQGEPGNWDQANTAGGIALADTEWGGSGHMGTYEGKYWLTYIGGAKYGYEGIPLDIGLAHTDDPGSTKHWTRLPEPIMTVDGPGAGDWESGTLYKSFVMEDPDRTLGPDARFIMYYNGKHAQGSEYIGMATSPDMRNWRRHEENPIIVNGGKSGAITGDPQIVKIGDVWVMFYFGAFWDAYPENDSAAFDTFACSYDLVNWTKWDGPNLIDTTGGHDSIDKTFAHKPWILKHEGIVYHFYCAVGARGRVIAMASSVDLRKTEEKKEDAPVAAE